MTIFTRRWAGVGATILGFVIVAPIGAQGRPPSGGRSSGLVRSVPGDNDVLRAQQERRLQDRIDQVVRQRLELTDDQFAKVKAVASRIEDDRRTLRNEEMTARFAMRRELLAGAKADEAKVADVLDKLPRFERRRVDIMEQEQRELAKFLTPSQRARYIGLQEELRRGMQDVQRRRMENGTVPAGRSQLNRRPPNSPPDTSR